MLDYHATWQRTHGGQGCTQAIATIATFLTLSIPTVKRAHALFLKLGLMEVEQIRWNGRSSGRARRRIKITEVVLERPRYRSKKHAVEIQMGLRAIVDLFANREIGIKVEPHKKLEISKGRELPQLASLDLVAGLAAMRARAAQLKLMKC